MSMYDTARSRRLQEQQRKVLAKHGTWPDSYGDSVIERIKRMMRTDDRH